MVEVRSSEQQDKDARARPAAEGDTQQRLIFPTYELFHQMLPPVRLAILEALVALPPMSVGELAERLGREVQAVEKDIASMASEGIVDLDEAGNIDFPFDKIHVEFSVDGRTRSAA
ncbi:MAG: HVO_A0114 family putative DNA-binding protein [Devosia sp.]